MLNPKTNLRELAYLAKVTDIVPIDGADKVEIAMVQGWSCVVKKNEFKVGDIGIFFEADSRVPEKEPFMFLESKHFKIKVQKFFKGTVLSNGLLLPVSEFEETYGFQKIAGKEAILSEDGKEYNLNDETRFLTDVLEIKYASEEDNKRKAKTPDSKKLFKQKHPKFAKTRFGKYCLKNDLLFRLISNLVKDKKKKDKFPYWVQRTDEERIENMLWILKDKETRWIPTEKIDGTSATFTIKRKGFKRFEYLVCSRNVAFRKETDKCFYKNNYYMEISEKYQIKKKMKEIMNNFKSFDFVTIQGEIYGKGIQKRNYNLKGQELAIFNVIFGWKSGTTTRLNPIEMREFLNKYNLPAVPVLENNYTLPDSLKELREYVAKEASKIDEGMREGIVFRSENGKRSFKCVDPEYIIKYH